MAMQIVLMGAPCSGKSVYEGAVQSVVASKFNTIAMGDHVRKQLATEHYFWRSFADVVWRGDLLPDALIYDEVVLNITKDYPLNLNTIWDGYPRNKIQAKDFIKIQNKAADSYKSEQKIIVLKADVDKEVAIQRMNYRLEMFAAQGKTIRRDDQLPILEKRLGIYKSQTEPMVETFNKHNIPVHSFNANEDIRDDQAKLAKRREEIRNILIHAGCREVRGAM